jgi:dTDP-4-amino-4,6-dideoxygalactose transaminase
MPEMSDLPRLTLPSDADASGRDFGEPELALLREVLASGTLNCTKGTHVKQFEKEFATRYAIPHCRAVASGTAACHTAMAALRLEPGDEVITTPITDMGAIAAILYVGAIPAFADVDPITLNVTAETVAARITPRTRAIVATHLFGNPCDMAGILAVAARHRLPVVEDCAQAFLATSGGRLVGTLGAIGAFSLQQGKHMTTGEGGMVITSEPALARHMVLFSDKAWGYGDPNPDHYFLAPNYRMTELQGAVARAQLRKCDGVVARRQATAKRFTDLVEGVRGLVLPKAAPGATHVYWKYPLIVDAEVIRGGADALGVQLRQRGVVCAPRYIQKPAFECQVIREQATFGTSRWPYSLRDSDPSSLPTLARADFPGTYRGLASVVVLPWNEQYTDEHVEFLARAVEESVSCLQ